MMNHIAEIFSYVTLCIILLCLMLALAINAHAVTVPDGQAELPIKAEIVDCSTQEKIQNQCYSRGLCCQLLEPASGDMVTPEWTPTGEQQGIDVMPEDVIVE